jgi:hypothetical protein
VVHPVTASVVEIGFTFPGGGWFQSGSLNIKIPYHLYYQEQHQGQRSLPRGGKFWNNKNLSKECRPQEWDLHTPTTQSIFSTNIENNHPSEITSSLKSRPGLPGAIETQAGHFHRIPSFGCMAKGAMRPAATGLR